MEISHQYISHDGVSIHFADSGEQSSLVPLVICPVMGSAVEVAEFANSAHAIRSTEQQTLFATIQAFLVRQEQRAQ